MSKFLSCSLLSLSLLAGFGSSYAGDTPLYQPTPDWVLMATPPEKIAASDDKLQAVVLDNQIRVQNGVVWNYGESAQRVTSADALNKMGSIVLKWWPDHGDLIIHGVDIIRDGHRIDVLAQGQKFTVLRREANLENLMLDGLLTATLAAEGLRVGDILDLRYSTTFSDTTLQGNVSASAGLVVEPVRVGFGRVRALWQDSDAINWKLYLTGATPKESRMGDWHEISVMLPIAKQPDAAAGAPGRYYKPQAIELSSFADWKTVSKIMAPLYVTDGLIQPGGSLDQEVQKIAQSTNDKRQRAALALQLAQNKVRYFLKAMDGGNYVPQAPEQTWATRFGDCKAKSLLLLAVLHQLGVEAEPIIANLNNGDMIPARIPSVAAFNHVLVLAHIDGQDLYLDGTGLGSMPEDLNDVPHLYWVLPVSANGADLLKVPDQYPARPMIEFISTIDMRGGINLPAATKLKFTYRGPMAGMMNTNLNRLDKEGREKFLIGAIRQVPNFNGATSPEFEFDEAKATATITVDGVFQQNWSRSNNRYEFDPVGFTAPPPPDRSRAIWKDIPVFIPPTPFMSGRMVMLLPDKGKGISLDGDQQKQIELPGNRRYQYDVSIKDGVLDINFKLNHAGGEISAADLPDLRKKIAELARHPVKVRTSTDYPQPWAQVEKAKKEHLYDEVLRILGQSIQAKPDEAKRYLTRAAFLTIIFEREQALADMTKALTLQADKPTYLARAELYRELGQDDKAMADLHVALELDPVDDAAITSLSRMEALTHQFDSAITRMDAAIDNGGAQEAALVQSKAEILFFADKSNEAIESVNAAIEKWPRNASLYNMRCWLRGIANVDLDEGKNDCAHAIQLGDQIAAAALDSRAMIYYKQHNYTDAIADINAALEENPNQSGSLFMKAVVERELGKKAESAKAIAGARLLDPRVEQEYARYGVKW